MEPVPGHTLQISLDYNLQTYAQQMAEKVLEEKKAQKVAVLLMNPQTGDPCHGQCAEFDLNEPFRLNTGTGEDLTDEELQDALNQMWRNGCINDTYERDPPLRSSRLPPVWRRGWWILRIPLPVPATGSWRIGRSAATRWAAMGRRPRGGDREFL